MFGSVGKKSGCWRTLSQGISKRSGMNESCPDDVVQLSSSELLIDYGFWFLWFRLISCLWFFRLVLVLAMPLAIGLVIWRGQRLRKSTSLNVVWVWKLFSFTCEAPFIIGFVYTFALVILRPVAWSEKMRVRYSEWIYKHCSLRPALNSAIEYLIQISFFNHVSKNCFNKSIRRLLQSAFRLDITCKKCPKTSFSRPAA